MQALQPENSPPRTLAKPSTSSRSADLSFANPHHRIFARGKGEQFIDHEFGLATLYLNPLQRPHEQVGLPWS